MYVYVVSKMVMVLLLPAGSAGASPDASIAAVVDHGDSDTDGMLFLSLVRYFGGSSMGLLGRYCYYLVTYYLLVS